MKAQPYKTFSNTSVAWQHSILTKIKLWFFLIMLGMLVVSAYSIDRMILPLLEQETTKLVIRAGNEMVLEVRDKLVVAKTLAVSLANIASQLPQDELSHKTLIPQVFNTSQLTGFIAGGGIWPEPFLFDKNIERRSFFWGRNKDNQFEYHDDYNDPKGAGYHQEEWYVPTQYIAKDQVYWSKSYVDPYSYQPMVTSASPIFRNNKFYGVSTIDIKLEGIKAILKKQVESLGGYAFMLDRNGRFISFPDQNIGLELFRDNEYITMAELAEQEQIFRPFYQQIITLVTQTKNAQAGLAEKIAQQSYQIDDQEAEIIASIISSSAQAKKDSFIRSFHLEQDALCQSAVTVMLFRMPDTHWTLGIVIPREILFSSVSKITTKIMEYQFIAMLIFMVTLFFILRRSLRLPLVSIMNQLQTAIKTNKYQLIEYRKKDEFGLLSNWFNKRTELLKHSEQELKNKTYLLQSALDAANAGTIFYDIKSDQLTWDERSYDIFDVDPEVFDNVFEGWRQCVHPDDITVAETKFYEAVYDKTIKEFEMEYRVVTATKGIRWVQVHTEILRGSDGYAISCSGLHFDITSKKLANKRLKEFERRFHTLFDLLPDSIVIIDFETFDLIEFNTAAHQQLGYSRDEFSNLTICSLNYDLKQDEIPESQHKIRVSRNGNIEVRQSHKEGAILSRSVIYNTIELNNREVIVMVWHDLTEKKQTERMRLEKEAAELANITKSEFLANMSHELRTPLHGILSFSSLGESRLDSVSLEKLGKYFLRINESGNRLLNLLNNLLDLSKLEAGKMQFEFADTDLKRIVGWCIEEQSAVLMERQLTVTVREVGCSKVSCDDVRIGQVITNYLSNAIKFSPDQSEIVIEIQAKPLDLDDGQIINGMQLSVADKGIGIPANELETVFDKFIQSSKTKTNAGGTGLGLSICSEIIKGHQGKLWAESDNNGSTFYLLIPLNHCSKL